MSTMESLVDALRDFHFQLWLYKGKLGVCLQFVCYFYGKYVDIVGLKAPESYSASFLCNKISV